jgi:catechol 2,3-dioxygenase-like lactoylglutathione lyase family enzyme
MSCKNAETHDQWRTTPLRGGLMTLNHLDLHVPNVFQTRDFLTEFLGFKLISSPTAPTIAILEDQDGFVLVLQKQKLDTDRYPAGFHIGFYVEGQSIVDELQTRFKSAGYSPSDIEKSRRGYYFYVPAPGGFLVEINSRSCGGNGCL